MPRYFRCFFLFLIFHLLHPVSLGAADVLVSFDNEQQSSLYHALLREYRCLKCQNQNLADSAAGLAEDLRREIREQILAGKNEQHIETYLVARYGEFVLYRPKFSSKTAVLWIGPFVLLLIGLFSIVLMVRKRSSKFAVTDAERAAEFAEPEMAQRLKKANELLKE